MKRIVPLLVVALALAAFWFRDHWLPPPPGQTSYLGYVEGETVLVGAPAAGRLVEVKVVKGGDAAAGTVLFRLDGALAEADIARAEASVAAAEATHDNLLEGKREPERAVIRAERSEAEAGLDLARKELARAKMLANTGTAAQSRLENAESMVSVYNARIAKATASEDVALLPARPYEVAAAEARVAEAKAGVALARQKLSDLSPTAPVAARVDDVFFEAGEWVTAGQPVVSLLPPGATTLRFFVPEAGLASAQPGTKVTFHCDGCGEAMTATVTRTASQPEYTPPVIYSQGARAKLVYLVEARPDSVARLQPGLPIEVEPLP